MRRALGLVAVLAASSSAIACKNVVPTFALPGTDGRVYSAKSFLSKPTIVVFLKADCPGSPDLARSFSALQSELRGQANVVGFVKMDAMAATAYAKDIEAYFPLIADPTGKTMAAFGAKRGGEFTFVASSKEARFPKIWDGYSRSLVAAAIDGIRHHGGTVSPVSLLAFPTEKTYGCRL